MDDQTANPDTSSARSDARDTLSRGLMRRLDASGAVRLIEAENAFLSQILEDYDPEELPDIDLSVMEKAIADAWLYGAQKPDGRLLRRIEPLTDGRGSGAAYDLIELVQTDSPFIVETVMGELIERGVSVRSMFHPLVTVRRDADGQRVAAGGEPVKESMMLVFIEGQTEAQRAAILAGLDDSLNDLKLAVHDFARMQNLLAQEIAALEALRDHAVLKPDPAVIDENLAFLRWIDANHFVFLGARGYVYPRNEDGSYAREAPLSQLQEGYGILRDPALPVLRRTSEPAVLNAQILNQLENSEPVTVAKANLRSRVHRRVAMDYIGIKRYGPDGRPSGEVRFVGLFTSEAYDRPAFEVPLVRRKCEHVLREAAALGLQGGYNEKRLKNILETYPRDELFQMDEGDLLSIARGILHLSDRPRVKLFTRHDPFDRFVSVLLYIPRDVYQTRMQQQAGDILAAAWGGTVSAIYPYISESLLSCIHYIIAVEPGNHFAPSGSDIEADIEDMTRSWPQKVASHAHEPGVRAALPTHDATIDWAQWAAALPPGYQARYDTGEALLDIAHLAALTEAEPVRVRAYQRLEDADRVFRFKLYTRSERAIALSDILPVLDNMGVKTLEEYGHAVRSPERGALWVHEFILRAPQGAAGRAPAFESFRAVFEATLMALRHGLIENDGFNALALSAIGWREVALLRTLARYRVQSGLDPSPDIQQAALRDNPDVTRALLELFRIKFDPARVQDREERIDWARAMVDDLLQAVASLDNDRVLRRIAAVISAARRTNFYQTGANGQPKPYISIKIASRELADLPEPKPYREIFVWSPRVEGVHLRFGPVARGGLRWSDRREDFRTEVLGLVKAQQVKNAVIVPVGSKGGFYPKMLPRPDSGPDAVREEAITAYKIFLRGLLDLTDSIDASGAIVPPPQVVRHDEDDPYLVVAADKGTATFSDIANGVSAEYGFWLGDAFASGGSVGYDHKAMGITARGAWEAVKRHFRELGKDIQLEPFTVAGVGDMSGDVFGNGMLLSETTRLVAAFDHRDIFIDPDPDPAISFRERQRLFALPRSSWQDYDRALISKGGGVFSRGQKSIPLSAEIRALLDLDAEAVTPFELMQAILKMRVELLYFGGIGTYIKASSQSNLEVGDKANDAIRIDGSEVRAQVIGEGANLGLTQAGRIACAMAGVRLNTDAIDNSAGVDCSDHEVNIKILLGSLMASGELAADRRDALLASMTNDVAAHVLRHNYDQTLALSLQEMSAAADNAAAQAFMTGLEKRGRLDRRVEGLPSNADMAARLAHGQGLYRPELAVVTAYAKLVLFDDIIASDAPDDPGFEAALTGYFPDAVRDHRRAIRDHRLHREIIATVLSNQIVNMAGPSFATRLMRGAGVDAGVFTLAFEATCRLFAVRELWAEVDALDNRLPAADQLALYARLSRFVRHQTWWTARRAAMLSGDSKISLAAMIAPYAEGLRNLMGGGDLPSRLSRLETLHHAADVIDLAAEYGKPLDKTMQLYALTGEKFGFDSLREGAGSLSSDDPWDRMATRRLIEDVLVEQKTVVRTMMARMTLSDQPADIIEAWADDNAGLIDPLRAMMDDMQAGGWSFAKLSIVNAVLREWAGRL